MSVRIGEIPHPHLSNQPRAIVSASCGGVELLVDERLSLDPVDARNFAALLVRAADEVQRMRLPRALEPRREAFVKAYHAEHGDWPRSEFIDSLMAASSLQIDGLKDEL